ncbi:MAG: hypothetical protein GX657_11660 [Chloroflexi bacterium]|nr:hypothetical protein [Chloroflexota bacterium]
MARRKMTGLEAGHVGVFDYVLGAPGTSTLSVNKAWTYLGHDTDGLAGPERR